MIVFDDSRTATELKITQSYFHNPEPINWAPASDYADDKAIVDSSSYQWTHSLGDVINALIQAGLKIDFVHEFSTGFYKALPFMKSNEKGQWHLEGDKLPLTFSIKAAKI
jgi:hypothetical protein